MEIKKGFILAWFVLAILWLIKSGVEAYQRTPDVLKKPVNIDKEEES